MNQEALQDLIDEAEQYLLCEINFPNHDPGCSCHISPPCSRCVGLHDKHGNNIYSWILGTVLHFISSTHHLTFRINDIDGLDLIWAYELQTFETIQQTVEATSAPAHRESFTPRLDPDGPPTFAFENQRAEESETHHFNENVSRQIKQLEGFALEKAISRLHSLDHLSHTPFNLKDYLL